MVEVSFMDELWEIACWNLHNLHKKVLLYVGQATKMFLVNSDSKPAHVELNCLKLHQLGCSGYIEIVPDSLDPDTDIVAMYHMPTVVNGSSKIITILNSYFN